jgi:hypothetical protein
MPITVWRSNHSNKVQEFKTKKALNNKVDSIPQR